MQHLALSPHAVWPLLAYDNTTVVLGLFFAFFGIVLTVLGIFAFQDRELRPAIARTVLGLVMLASGLSMWGVF